MTSNVGHTVQDVVVVPGEDDGKVEPGAGDVVLELVEVDPEVGRVLGAALHGARLVCLPVRGLSVGAADLLVQGSKAEASARKVRTSVSHGAAESTEGHSSAEPWRDQAEIRRR